MRTAIPIILASASPYRKRLLGKLIDDFEVCPADIDESPRVDENLEKLAPRLAREKAEALSERYPDHWIIGSDQVALRDSIQLDKPGDYATAHRQLSESSGKCVDFVTSICLIGPGGANIRTETDFCKIYFRQMSTDRIDRYLRRERPYDCAASFKSEGSAIALVRKFEGDDPNALIGLPLILLTQMMEDFGLEVL